MMKAVLIVIQPYYVFLIIARLMGWDIPQEKTVEVRKDYPKDPAWNKKTHIYCGKNRKSFNRIPEQYKPFMKKLLGKVVGEFVCDSVCRVRADNMIAAYYNNNPEQTCLTDEELYFYANVGKPLYFWHISELKIYKHPARLDEFYRVGKYAACQSGNRTCVQAHITDFCFTCEFSIKQPPQSWRYCEVPK